jgi:hypothetical protein
MLRMHVQIVVEMMRSCTCFPHVSEMQILVVHLSEQCLNKSTRMCTLFLFLSPKCKQTTATTKTQLPEK